MLEGAVTGVKNAAWGALALLVVMLLSGWASRRLFPVRVTEIRFEPRVVTVHDTVTKLKPVRVVRVLTDTVTLTDTLTMALHDTLRLPWWTITALEPGPGPRQISLFTVDPTRISQARSVLEAPGPVIRLRADTTPSPRVDFGSWVTDTVTKKPWYFWPLVGAAVVGGVWIGRR
jgi:hypothetical protein